MLDPAVTALLAACFAVLFASAAWHKLRDLPQFAAVFAAYRLASPRLAWLAPLVPLAEILAAAGLIPAGTRPVAVLLGAGLLLLYAAALAVNLARGRRDLSCGCGGPNDRRPIAAWMVLRNVLLALLLLSLWLPVAPRALGPADALTFGAGTLVVALIYMSVDDLLGRVGPRGAQLKGAQ